MDVRLAILTYLATPHADARLNYNYLPAAIRSTTNCRPHEVSEALWSLVADGLIYLDPEDQAPDNWRWKLSQHGVRAAAGGAWEPRDPEGYLRRLKGEIPDIDPRALRYVEEALRAFGARCYLACAVMLGVAAEQVFNGLAAAFTAAHPQETAKLAKLLTDPRASQRSRFMEFRVRLDPHRGALPGDLGDVLTLDAVADLLRITRNEAGHPTGADVDEDTARTHLQMAALYLRKMTTLQRHFSPL